MNTIKRPKNGIKVPVPEPVVLPPAEPDTELPSMKNTLGPAIGFACVFPNPLTLGLLAVLAGYEIYRKNQQP